MHTTRRPHLIVLTALALFPIIGRTEDAKFQPLEDTARAERKSPPSHAPNILFILADDQGYGDLSCTGNSHVKTPSIDGLAKEGVTFDRFYVSPLCAPTRASILTGRYSLRTGTRGVAAGAETMRAEETTIAEVLRGAGWKTGLFGKWHNGEHFPCSPNGRGFDEFIGFTRGHWNNYFDTGLQHNGSSIETKGYITDVITDAALSFIASNRASPFFAFVAYNVPHSPFQCPDENFDKFKKAGLDDRLACIYGMTENLDANVGRLLARLDEMKLRDNTIVIYTSDNGPNGERFNGGMRGTKGSAHEGGSREPFFMRWPAKFKKPHTVSEITAHIDLFPTLLEYCGVQNTGTLPLDGVSLAPLLEKKEGEWPDRALFTQHMMPDARKFRAAVRTQQYRLVHEGPQWELFDMKNDPGQKTDISDKKPGVKEKLIADYETWWKDVAADAHRPVPPVSIGHEEEDPVILAAADADFEGGVRFYGKHANNNWLVNWTQTTARAVWKVSAARAGGYLASIEFLCAETNSGSDIRISAGNSTTVQRIPATPIEQVPQPDRVPREEVPEMKWRTIEFGGLELQQGENTITLEPASIHNGDALWLKSLILKRAN